MNEAETLQQYDYLVGKIWGKYIYKTPEVLFWKEDILQEGRIGLLNAIRYFDSYKPHSDFLPFACMCIRRSMIWSIKKKYNNRYGIYDPKKCVSIYEDLGDGICLEDILASNDSASDETLYNEDASFMRDILNVTDVKTQLIIPLILDGYNPIEIQTILNIERHKVSAYISKFKKLVKKLYSYRDRSDFPRRQDYKLYDDYLAALSKFKRKKLQKNS